MRKSEIIEALRGKAAELGLPFSERMLRDWVDEGIIPTAERLSGTTSEWSYHPDTIRRGELILTLKKQRVSRADLLVLYLWVDGHDVHVERLLRALKSEFSRTLSRVRRGNPPPLDTRFGGEPNAWQKRRLQSENQKLDPSFREVGISYEPELLSELFSAFYFGEAEPGSDRNFFNSLFSGIFGSDDEMEGSFAQQINDVSEQNIIDTKDFFWDVIFSIILAPTVFQGFIPSRNHDKLNGLSEIVVRSLLSPEWLAIALAFIAVTFERFRSADDANNDAV